MYRYVLLAIATTLVACSARADYLNISRSASLKSDPSSDGTVIAKLAPDAVAILLQDAEQNGYYRVRVVDTAQEGWVYRTMGRRYLGQPESAVLKSSEASADKTPPNPEEFAPPAPPNWGAATKTSSCRSKSGLPDSACTPGEVRSDATADEICSATFHTRSIRDKTTSPSQKNAVYPMYDVTHPEHNTGSTQACEIDHLVPLELGGADTIANLWPECSQGYESWQGPGFRDKDGFENYLWFHVCANQDITLHDAQSEIATNWRKYWELAGKPDCHSRENCE